MNLESFRSALSDEDAKEAVRRAEFLHRHNAPKDWAIVSIQEMRELRAQLNAALAAVALIAKGQGEGL